MGDVCRCPKCGTQHTPGVSVTVTDAKAESPPADGGVPFVPPTSELYGDEEGDDGAD